MNGNATSDLDLIHELRERYVTTLGEVLGDITTVALVDFPHHENVGDSAIWLGERAALERLGCEVVHVGEVARHDSSGLRRRLGDEGALLLHGGGNLGDLWPQHQEFRVRILEQFADRKVVLLAQSMHFTDPAAGGRAAAAFEGHPDLTILARDRRTLDRATSLWTTPTRICPDAAFMLHPRSDSASSSKVGWLLRSDHETAGTAERISVDWLHTRPRSSPSRWVENVLEGALRSATVVDRSMHGRRQVALPAAFDALARLQLRRGVHLVRGCGAVVTDRLHGHLLCLLLGVPHVLVADAYGKVRAFYDTWTSSSRLAHWADSVADAEALAQELAAS